MYLGRAAGSGRDSGREDALVTLCPRWDPRERQARQARQAWQAPPSAIRIARSTGGSAGASNYALAGTSIFVHTFVHAGIGRGGGDAASQPTHSQPTRARRVVEPLAFRSDGGSSQCEAIHSATSMQVLTTAPAGIARGATSTSMQVLTTAPAGIERGATSTSMQVLTTAPVGIARGATTTTSVSSSTAERSHLFTPRADPSSGSCGRCEGCEGCRGTLHTSSLHTSLIPSHRGPRGTLDPRRQGAVAQRKHGGGA